MTCSVQDTEEEMIKDSPAETVDCQNFEGSSGSAMVTHSGDLAELEGRGY